MLTVYSDRHRLHSAAADLINGRMEPPVEKPARADTILNAVHSAQLGEVREPATFGVAPILRVHDERLVHFLEHAWSMWVEAHGPWDAVPRTCCARGMQAREPETIDGKLAFFATEPGTPITAGTWDAARSAADVALSGVAALDAGARGVFSLCRPPGHHAARDYYGGYCFLNNAAIAAQNALDRGASRVAVLDVDYHHGNGTQSIFYERSDVVFASIHADPRQDYPFFLGYADETGSGEGEGYNLNLPLRWGSGWDQYEPALNAAIARIRRHAPDMLIVSLGVDTFERDPISRFKLGAEQYPKIGHAIASLRVPTLFVMEGGYAIDELGMNAVNVLRGFEGM